MKFRVLFLSDSSDGESFDERRTRTDEAYRAFVKAMNVKANSIASGRLDNDSAERVTTVG